MANVRILTETELRDLVRLDVDAVSCIEGAFAALAEGKVVMPPILSMAIPENNGEVDVKTAYVPGIDSFAIKMSPGFFDNPKVGLPSTSGLMILFSSKTGILEALLLDNGYLTDVRTAAVGAVAAKHLSRRNAKTACIVGTGMQARLQLKALTLVRPIESAQIWGRDRVKAEQLAEEVSVEYGIQAVAQSILHKAVTGADIIVTTTPTSNPLIAADWLRAGQHITAMGSDQDHKNELAPDCLVKADLYVADRLSQTEILGELRSAIGAGLSDRIERIAELGSVITQSEAGRIADEDITVAGLTGTDLTGTGIQDTAIATFAHNLALAANIGTRFDT